MTKAQEGGCHCGGLRYRVRGALTDVAHCHCTICRRVSGAPVVTWVTLARGDFQWLIGEAQCYVAPTSCRRYFCGRCGAHVALLTEHDPQSIDVTVATLDHPEHVRPNRHIWVGTRLPWLHLDEDLPGELGERL